MKTILHWKWPWQSWWSNKPISWYKNTNNFKTLVNIVKGRVDLLLFSLTKLDSWKVIILSMKKHFFLNSKWLDPRKIHWKYICRGSPVFHGFSYASAAKK